VGVVSKTKRKRKPTTARDPGYRPGRPGLDRSGGADEDRPGASASAQRGRYRSSPNAREAGSVPLPWRGSALAQNTMLHLLKVQLGRADEATVHGFRSCFTDWATEQTNFPSEVREMALAHAVGDKVEAAYRRGDLFDSGECQHRRAHQQRRTRRQYAGRHPPRSISAPFCRHSDRHVCKQCNLNAIFGVKRFSTATVQFSPSDTRDRYLACRQFDAQALRREGSRRAPRAPTNSRAPVITTARRSGVGLPMLSGNSRTTHRPGQCIEPSETVAHSAGHLLRATIRFICCSSARP
jgi:hypothetical protein